jgi:predicted TIM-barrel fold metal-dependent hydrolase
MKIFDSHFHVIPKGFPLFSNNNYLPHHYSVLDYKKDLCDYDLIGGVVVSGSFQGLDQTYLINSLDKLGNSYVGVAQLPCTVEN